MFLSPTTHIRYLLLWKKLSQNVTASNNTYFCSHSVYGSGSGLSWAGSVLTVSQPAVAVPACLGAYLKAGWSGALLPSSHGHQQGSVPLGLRDHSPRKLTGCWLEGTLSFWLCGPSNMGACFLEAGKLTRQQRLPIRRSHTLL